jgi:hypothetical protein
VFRGHGKEINWLQADARHKRLATGSRDGTIRVWELPDWQHEDGEEGTGQVVFVLRGHSGSAVAGSGGVYCGALVNCALYTAGANGQLLQWDLQEGGSVYGCGCAALSLRPHRASCRLPLPLPCVADTMCIARPHLSAAGTLQRELVGHGPGWVVAMAVVSVRLELDAREMGVDELKALCRKQHLDASGSRVMLVRRVEE